MSATTTVDMRTPSTNGMPPVYVRTQMRMSKAMTMNSRMRMIMLIWR